MSHDFEVDTDVSCEELTVSPHVGLIFVFKLTKITTFSSFSLTEVAVVNGLFRGDHIFPGEHVVRKSK